MTQSRPVLDFRMSHFRTSLSRLPWLRIPALRVLRSLGCDFTIRNPWTGDPLLLNMYRHKGYWYYGADRERETMETFHRLIRPGDTVFDVGSHIGFITQYFATLVGVSGRVIAFEPGLNNLRYAEANLAALANVTLERVAVSSIDGTAVLYEDGIGGQNNSLNADYYYVRDNAASHGVQVQQTAHEVATVTLDSYIARSGVKPDFLKIDVESLELEVLRGASRTLGMVRALMVEVTQNKKEVVALLKDAGLELEFQLSGNTVGVRQTHELPCL